MQSNKTVEPSQTVNDEGTMPTPDYSPAALHQNAHNYLNSEGGQLHDTLEQMCNASKSGAFATTARNLSKFTVQSLKQSGHDVQDNGAGLHTISWNMKPNRNVTDPRN